MSRGLAVPARPRVNRRAVLRGLFGVTVDPDRTKEAPGMTSPHLEPIRRRDHPPRQYPKADR